VRVAVSDLQTEFPDRIVAGDVDATTADAALAVKELEFGNHGIVIRSGAGEVLWKQPDHEVNIEDVRAALTELLSQQ
jgi:hypothetical protein